MQAEQMWGQNSGNSYNNGPFTHFYHGKAFPYSVIKDDVQPSQSDDIVNFATGMNGVEDLGEDTIP